MTSSDTIGIVGAGTMGSGIAQVAAMAGHRVKIYDAVAEARNCAPAKIAASLKKAIEKGTLEESDSAKILGRISVAGELADFSDTRLLIEAIVEQADIKRSLIAALGSILPDGAIAASNTSSLIVTGLAAAFRQPDRFIGMHFFNPAPVMELVEVVPALQSSAGVVESVRELLTTWKKDPIVVQDTPGFLVNRIARPFYGEALRIAEEGTARPEQIDAAMKTYGGFHMGPFELMDLIGNDVNYAVTESIFRDSSYDRRYLPSHLQRKYVEAGYLGRKSGRGFYEYGTTDRSAGVVDEPQGREIALRILVMLISEAVEALRLGMASKEDIERAMTKGTNYPKGLLRWADDLGSEIVLRRMLALFETYGDDRYRPSPLLRSMAREKRRFFS